MTHSEYLSFVRKYLIVEGTRCYRHCENLTHFKSLIETGDRLVGAYLCPGSYASRIVYFAIKSDPQWFRNLLQKDLAGNDRIRAKDIRIGTRHGWELGQEAETQAKKLNLETEGIKEYYWTFYPSGDYEKQNGNFLCEECGKLFVQPNSSNKKVCQRHSS